MSVTSSHINLTPPPRPRPPSLLPPLPTFESTLDFSLLRSQSPDLPATPSPTRITSPNTSPNPNTSSVTDSDGTPDWSGRKGKGKMLCFKAPPPSPRFQPLQPMNDNALRNVCTFASLALSIEKSSTDINCVPGLTDSFTSSSCYSSDEHDHDREELTADEDPYHASTSHAWNSYYTPESPTNDHGHEMACEQSYILPSAESCYALGFGKLGCPATPSPVKPTTPIRRPPTTNRPSPLRTRTAPSPSSAAVRPSLSIRRNPSGKSQRSTRTMTQSRYNSTARPFIPRASTTISPVYDAEQGSPSLSLAQALSSIPPPPPIPNFCPTSTMPVAGVPPRSPLEDYTPPYLSLFPMSARHSTPNGEIPPFPMPTRRAPRPVTAPCQGAGALIGSATTVLGSAGGAFVVPMVEKSVWEEDSDEEEENEGQKEQWRWHRRGVSAGNGQAQGSGSGRRRRERERWGKRSASDVVKGLFGLH